MFMKILFQDPPFLGSNLKILKAFLKNFSDQNKAF